MEEKGFTLLELVVIVSIIAALSTIVLSGYNTGETKFTLVRSANKLAQDIRKAENMAMIGKDTPVTFGETFPSGGYGVYFYTSTSTRPNSYTLFGDCDGDKEYDSGGNATSCAAATATTTFPEIIETMSLETEVYISNISFDTTSTESCSITFYPPDPIIRIVGPSSQSYDEVTITLNLHGNTKEITINTVGLIDID